MHDGGIYSGQVRGGYYIRMVDKEATLAAISALMDNGDSCAVSEVGTITIFTVDARRIVEQANHRKPE